jgi:hypothetical protein
MLFAYSSSALVDTGTSGARMRQPHTLPLLRHPARQRAAFQAQRDGRARTAVWVSLSAFISAFVA